MHALGRPYVFMAVVALAGIGVGRALTQTPFTNARLALVGIIGAAVGLGCLKLVDFYQRRE